GTGPRRSLEGGTPVRREQVCPDPASPQAGDQGSGRVGRREPNAFVAGLAEHGVLQRRDHRGERVLGDARAAAPADANPRAWKAYVGGNLRETPLADIWARA